MSSKNKTDYLIIVYLIIRYFLSIVGKRYHFAIN